VFKLLQLQKVVLREEWVGLFGRVGRCMHSNAHSGVLSSIAHWWNTTTTIISLLSSLLSTRFYISAGAFFSIDGSHIMYCRIYRRRPCRLLFPFLSIDWSNKPFHHHRYLFPILLLFFFYCQCFIVVVLVFLSWQGGVTDWLVYHFVIVCNSFSSSQS
jgi:hypothetical protein